MLPILHNITNQIFTNIAQYYISNITQYSFGGIQCQYYSTLPILLNITYSILLNIPNPHWSLKTVVFLFNMCQYSSILQAISNILQYSSILPEQLGDGGSGLSTWRAGRAPADHCRFRVTHATDRPGASVPAIDTVTGTELEWDAQRQCLPIRVGTARAHDAGPQWPLKPRINEDDGPRRRTNAEGSIAGAAAGPGPRPAVRWRRGPARARTQSERPSGLRLSSSSSHCSVLAAAVLSNDLSLCDSSSDQDR